jgi:RNA polymerase sigma-70 factor (sigma-E family)
MTEEDFSEFVEQTWARLFRTSYALTGDTASAEDLLQTTLVKTYVHWDKVTRAETPDAYVRRMMVNLATSGWRSRRRRREVLTDEPTAQRAGGHAPNVEGFESELAARDELWEVVLRLPSRQRAVVVLRYYEDLSEREIAHVLDVAPGTVKSLANAAMTRLREACSSTSPLGDLR